MNERKSGVPQFKLPKHQVISIAKSFKDLEAKVDTISSLRERIIWAERILNMPDSWKKSQGKGIKVAVLDTGIDPEHPDLKKAIIGTHDFTGDGIQDVNGHGTHCAGIIGARLNGIGCVGVAPKCNLLIAKVLDNNGSGSYEWIANGIDWAIQQNADIISMSLGGPSTTPVMHRSIHLALAEGKSIFCAAGNDGSLGGNCIGYPGRYGSVITIAAHDRSGNPAGFSSRGGEIDFMAPGTEIWSTYKDSGYAELSGTSMATPFAAGMGALILSKHRSHQGETSIETNEDLRDHLLYMSTHPGWHDNATGYGPLLPFHYFG
jgi:subtilisin family serine protease